MQKGGKNGLSRYPTKIRMCGCVILLLVAANILVLVWHQLSKNRIYDVSRVKFWKVGVIPIAGGGSLRLKPMLICVYGRVSNGPISLKFMIEESHYLWSAQISAPVWKRHPFWEFPYTHVNTYRQSGPLGTNCHEEPFCMTSPTLIPNNYFFIKYIVFMRINGFSCK